MTVLATVAGLALIALAVRDVFDTLFHPHGRGVVSEALVRATWRAFHALARGHQEVLSYAGPTAFLLVVLSWVALVVLGSAVIILPHLPGSYVLTAGLDPAATSGFVDAVYVSLVSLTSLGHGDVVAQSDALRLLSPIETMIGLGILTASISWILSIYGVLADYRSASHEIALLSDAQRTTGIPITRVDPTDASRLLGELTSKLIAARRDLLHFPIAYYFHTRDPRHALSTQLPTLLEIVDDASSEDRAPALRVEAVRLRLAVEDFLATIDAEFLAGGRLTPGEALDAYQRDHLREVSDSASSRPASTRS